MFSFSPSLFLSWTGAADLLVPVVGLMGRGRTWALFVSFGVGLGWVGEKRMHVAASRAIGWMGRDGTAVELGWACLSALFFGRLFFLRIYQPFDTAIRVSSSGRRINCNVLVTCLCETARATALSPCHHILELRLVQLRLPQYESVVVIMVVVVEIWCQAGVARRRISSESEHKQTANTSLHNPTSPPLDGVARADGMDRLGACQMVIVSTYPKRETCEQQAARGSHKRLPVLVYYCIE